MNEDKELEEAIKIYKGLKNYKEIIKSIDTDFFFNFSETVLQALQNSIPKKKIEDIIEEINIDIEINRERKINNEKYANLSMKSIFYEPEIVKARLLRLLEDK